MQAQCLAISSSLHKPISVRQRCKVACAKQQHWSTQQSSRRAPLLHRRNHACSCSACQPTVSLPNGLEICYASQYDVNFLYREIFQDKVYLQHGIQLQEGDTVLDIGGNIGFFALFAAQSVGSAGQVVTAEPIPQLHAKLLYNVEAHSQWCKVHGKYMLLPLQTTLLQAQAI